MIFKAQSTKKLSTTPTTHLRPSTTTSQTPLEVINIPLLAISMPVRVLNRGGSAPSPFPSAQCPDTTPLSSSYASSSFCVQFLLPSLPSSSASSHFLLLFFLYLPPLPSLHYLLLFLFPPSPPLPFFPFSPSSSDEFPSLRGSRTTSHSALSPPYFSPPDHYVRPGWRSGRVWIRSRILVVVASAWELRQGGLIMKWRGWVSQGWRNGHRIHEVYEVLVWRNPSYVSHTRYSSLCANTECLWRNSTDHSS